MNKKIPELLVTLALFVSPLLHNSIENSFQTRTMWSWCLLISASIIVFFGSYPFRVRTILPILSLGIFIVLFSSVITATYPVNPLALYFALLVGLLSLAIKVVSTANPTNRIIFTVLLLGMLAMYAQWGIFQFIVQHDLGMKVLGESVLTQNLSGVASFYRHSEKIIRAYGPFSHANSLGGVLLLGIILLYVNRDVVKNSHFIHSIAFILSLGIIVSFSRTALLGLFLVGIYSIYKQKNKVIYILPAFLAFIALSSLIIVRSNNSHSTSATERIQGLQWYSEILTLPVSLRGFGLGNYTRALADHVTKKSITFNSWDIAPIHNVPLLLVSELGIISLFILAILAYRYRIWKLKLILLVLLPAIFFDHYFATQFAPIVFLITSANLVVQ